MSNAIVKNSLLLTVIILLPLTILAQTLNKTKTDSLLNITLLGSNDTTKASAFYQLARDYYYVFDNKQSLLYTNKGLAISEKVKWKKGLALGYARLGANYWVLDDFTKAQDYFGKSLRIAQEIGDKLQISHNLHNIGNCYVVQGDYPKTLQYYKMSLKVSTEIGDKPWMSSCNAEIADVYIRQSNYAAALISFRESLKISGQINDIRYCAYIYQQMAAVYSILNNDVEAKRLGEKALEIFKKVKDYDFAANDVVGLGDIYLKEKNYSVAIDQYQEGLKILKQAQNTEIQNKRRQADFYNRIGGAYYRWAIDPGKYAGKNKNVYLKFASYYFQRSIETGKAVGFKDPVASSLGNLSDIQKNQGDFAGALKTYKQYIVYRDSLINSDKDKEYRRYVLSFENSRKKDSINYDNKLQKFQYDQASVQAENKLKQQTLYTVVAVIALLLIVSYFIFTNRILKINFKNQLAKEKSERELKQILFENKFNDLTLTSLKSQMNPHFIFNCLNSIKLYTEKNETEAASLYITKFSKLIRIILDGARLEKVTLAKEIELIELYLEMEQMRLKERLIYEIDIDKNIDIDFIEIPPLLIQPYVENGIWHGLMNKPEGGKIKVSISLSADERYLIVKITDDGIGRMKAAEIKQRNAFSHTSHAGNINNERIAILNAKYKTNIEVIIADVKNEIGGPGGTEVTIKTIIK